MRGPRARRSARRSGSAWRCREAFDVAVDPREAPGLRTARAAELAGPFTVVPIAALPPDYAGMVAVRASAVRVTVE